MREMSANEIHAAMQEGDLQPVLIDVREPAEFAICRIAGSLNIPMNDIAARINELDPDRDMILICHHGIRSRMVGNFLEQHAFGKLINLRGGIDAWSRDVDPTVPRY